MSVEHENSLYTQIGRLDGKLESVISSNSRAHTRIEELDKKISLSSDGCKKELSEFKTSVFGQFTEFSKIQARHTVIVGIISSVIAAIMAKIIGGMH